MTNKYNSKYVTALLYIPNFAQKQVKSQPKMTLFPVSVGPKMYQIASPAMQLLKIFRGGHAPGPP